MNVYDQARDLTLDLADHTGRLAGCVQVLLEYPDSPNVRSLARDALDRYDEWRELTLGLRPFEPAPLHVLIDEVQR